MKLAISITLVTTLQTVLAQPAIRGGNNDNNHRHLIDWSWLFSGATQVQTPKPLTECHPDMMAALLSRYIENVANKQDLTSDQIGLNLDDFNPYTQYWGDLWDVCSTSPLMSDLLINGKIFAREVTEIDGVTKHYAMGLATYSGRNAYVAFPGTVYDKDTVTMNQQSAMFGDWEELTNIGEVHEHFWDETDRMFRIGSHFNNIGTFDTLTVTGHSKGGVMAQYFLRYFQGGALFSDIYLTVFGAPNAGTLEFSSNLCHFDAIKRAKFYITKDSGVYDFIYSPRFVFPKKVLSFTDYLGVFRSGITIFPRGISRYTDYYTTEACGKFELETINTFGGGSGWDFATGWLAGWTQDQETAIDIHGDSYYLTALERGHASLDWNPLT